MNEAGTVLRVAHLTSGAGRQDTYCPVADVIPMTESPDWPQELFVRDPAVQRETDLLPHLRYGRGPGPRAVHAGVRDAAHAQVNGLEPKWMLGAPAGRQRVWAGLKGRGCAAGKLLPQPLR